MDKNRTRDTQIDFSNVREFIPQLAPIVPTLYEKLPQTIIAVCAGILVGIAMSALAAHLSTIGG